MSVAKPLPHDAAALHVTGAARYVDDIPTPKGTLHIAFALSDVAHGRLNGLDLTAARAAQGVHGVWSGDDISPMPDCSPSVHDEPLLCTGEVQFLGMPLCMIVADSHLNARRAAALVRADITPAQAILSIEDAMAAKSWFDGGPRVYARGDPDPALKAAPHRLTGAIEMGAQEHFYLEGQAALALPQEGGDMVVHSSTQHPTEVQHKVAHALGVPMHAVRVEVRRMGGGFGGKESQANALAIACAIAAARTGRPCKMRYDRDDDFMVTGKRHDARVAYEVGFDDDGRLLGVRFTHFVRCGWAQDLSLPVADRAMLHADNAYFLPAVEITSYRLRTHTQSATAFRGFGGPQGMLGIERVIEHVAHHLARDPLAVRRVNFYDEAGGASPPGPPRDISEPKRNTTHYGQEVSDFCLGGLVADLEDRAGYGARREAVDAWNAREPILKRGLGLTPVKFGISFTLTHLNQAGALVHVYQDGSVHLNHGGTEMGQGLFQKVAQVAAHRFGVGLEAIKITATDTGKVPNTSATAASSGSDLNGMAVQVACDKIKAAIVDWLGDPQARFVDGMVIAKGEARPFAEVVNAAYQARVPLSATGFYKTPDIAWDRDKGQGRPFYYFAYGAALTEVVVDTLTGENRILRTDIVHDVGASLNPALDVGQIEGGFVQGAGWLTMEELVWDDAGRLRTHAPSTYKIPAASDRPAEFNVHLWDGANREDTVYRSKAVGEPPFMLGMSALMALSDAVAACGDRFPALDAPATPERLLAAIEAVRA
ncbi:xanthine dehydrogenase molybdopterin binding subunit [Thalassobacter stenotrophicus]|uniref:Xanthine dehydrogenase, molybdenum binding subunit apoprotein n=2 Tax=Thalassobacter stenotrophicus TaxID=266809 RepID=A0ABY1I070_9RHOB|nr:xanthine dehydrogenase molybdopterin binding subunit [Thalassobacter stenotrophicus]PVZ49137.1 xanthine dehydrogenase molybdopterin binding subunit [Thalassobacter stenotrophicus]CUH61867.1 putative xanthine dehydrogenase subunit D [Thalassobacter stenotrophicus]SHI40224.1 xanthine dehydrogenase, molybdenum binding subunit apoprotein [Thalassobacter stenotrophicus DSM 16310]